MRGLADGHPRSSGWACALLQVAALLCCSGCSTPRFFDLAAAPPKVQAAYEVFSYRCSKCHSLSRPLNARVWTPEHWDLYVARMRRMPTSGISPEDAAVILTFLHYYARRRSAGDEALDLGGEDAGSSSHEVLP